MPTSQFNAKPISDSSAGSFPFKLSGSVSFTTDQLSLGDFQNKACVQPSGAPRAFESR